MRKILRKTILAIMLALTAISLFAFAGCGGKKPTETFTFNETAFELTVGESKQLTATGVGLSWESANTAIATVDENGKVTAVDVGETEIPVKCGELKGSVKVTVNAPRTLPTIDLDLEDKTLFVGDTFKLVPRVMWNGNEIAATVTYKSDDATKASVGEDGTITAVAIGETTINVTYTAFGCTDTVSIKVIIAEDISFNLSATDVTLINYDTTLSGYNKTQTIDVTRFMIKGQATDASLLTWKSRDESVATVNNGVITAVAAGETKIDVTYTEGEKDVVTMPVNVTVLRVLDYTINHYSRTFNGGWKLEETETEKGVETLTVSTEQKTFGGYTFNADTSTTEGVLDKDKPLTLNLYYEMDGLTLRSPSTIGCNKGTFKAAEMTDVPEADIRTGVYLFTKETGDNVTMMSVKYNEDDVGKYMLFHVYYTAIEKSVGLQLWTAVDNGNFTNNKLITAKTPFDTNGKQLTVTTNDTDKWLTFVLYLDENDFPKTSDKWKYSERTFYISFCHNLSANTLYIAEYAVVSADAATSFYESDTFGYYAVDINGAQTKLAEGEKIVKGLTVSTAKTFDGYEFLETKGSNSFYKKTSDKIVKMSDLKYQISSYMDTSATMTGENIREGVVLSNNEKGVENGKTYVKIDSSCDGCYLLFNVCFTGDISNAAAFRIGVNNYDDNKQPVDVFDWAVTSNGVVGFYKADGTSVGTNNFSGKPSWTPVAGEWYTVAIKIDKVALSTSGNDKQTITEWKENAYISISLHSGAKQAYYISHCAIVTEAEFTAFTTK